MFLSSKLRSIPPSDRLILGLLPKEVERGVDLDTSEQLRQQIYVRYRLVFVFEDYTVAPPLPSFSHLSLSPFFPPSLYPEQTCLGRNRRICDHDHEGELITV